MLHLNAQEATQPADQDEISKDINSSSSNGDSSTTNSSTSSNSGTEDSTTDEQQSSPKREITSSEARVYVEKPQRQANKLCQRRKLQTYHHDPESEDSSGTMSSTPDPVATGEPTVQGHSHKEVEGPDPESDVDLGDFQVKSC